MAVLVLWATSLRGSTRAQAGSYYVETDLATNHVATNERLINPWGIAWLKDGPFWINQNGSGFSSVYFGDGTYYFTVTIPPPPQGRSPSTPTGITANGNSGDFQGDQFIFACEDGTISGWSPKVGLKAQLRVDNSGTGAQYYGLAPGSSRGATFLFATNFKSGAIDVFDSKYAAVQPSSGGYFHDPDLPAGYAPFGISNMDGRLWISYALRSASDFEEVPGPGHGFIDIFDTDGVLVGRFASGGVLNSPWSMVVAPDHFGQFSRTLLVGNFGDGTINAFDRETGETKGQLTDELGNPVVIEGLWGLIFGNGGYAGPTNTLFFSAGSNHGTNGKFGRIQAVQPKVR